MAPLTKERSAGAGGVILVVRFAAGAVLNYAFGVGLTWLIAPSSFGTVGALQNVLLLATGMLTAGFPWALALKIAARSNSPELIERDFRTAFAGNAVLAVALATAFCVAQFSGLRLIPTHSTAVTVTVAIEIVVLGVNAVLNGALQGSRRFGGLGAMQSSEIVVKCVVALSLVELLHVGAEGVALGFVVGSLFATCVAVRALTGILPRRGPFATLRSLGMAAPIWVGTSSFTFLLTADLLALAVLGKDHGSTAAGLAAYQACGILARAAYFVTDALMDAVFPFMTENRESYLHSHRWFIAASRWIPLGIVPLQLVLLLAPETVLRLFFPASYTHDAVVLQLLTIGTLGLLITNNVVKGLYALHRASLTARLMPAVVVTEVVALVILIPRHGATGAAASYCIASWVGVLLLSPAYARAQHLRGLPIPFALRYGAALAVPVALILSAHLVRGASEWAPIVLAGVVYVAAARMLGLFNNEDVERFLSPLNRLRRRAATPTLGNPTRVLSTAGGGRHRSTR